MNNPHATRDRLDDRDPIVRIHPNAPSPASRTRLAVVECRRRLRSATLMLRSMSVAGRPTPPSPSPTDIRVPDGIDALVPHSATPAKGRQTPSITATSLRTGGQPARLGSAASGADATSALSEILAAQRACDDLLMVASHEVKTPLTVIRGRAQLAARAIRRGDPIDAAALLETLAIIDASAVRIAAHLDDLLAEAEPTEPDEPSRTGEVPVHPNPSFGHGTGHHQPTEHPHRSDQSVSRATRSDHISGRQSRTRDATRSVPWARGA